MQRVAHPPRRAEAHGDKIRRAVEHRSEVVPVAQLRLSGRQPHPHRQLQRTLRGDRGIDGGSWGCERRNHAIAGVAEQKAIVLLDRGAQHLVMRGQRHPHPVRVCLPPTGRTLNIGEE